MGRMEITEIISWSFLKAKKRTSNLRITAVTDAQLSLKKINKLFVALHSIGAYLKPGLLYFSERISVK